MKLLNKSVCAIFISLCFSIIACPSGDSGNDSENNIEGEDYIYSMDYDGGEMRYLIQDAGSAPGINKLL